MRLIICIHDININLNTGVDTIEIVPSSGTDSSLRHFKVIQVMSGEIVKTKIAEILKNI